MEHRQNIVPITETFVYNIVLLKPITKTYLKIKKSLSIVYDQK